MCDDIISRPEFRAILAKWRDDQAEEGDEHGCGLIEDVLTELDAQTPVPASPCTFCDYGGKHLDAPPCTNCPATNKRAAD